jgi:hypothetical protein
MGPCLLGAQLRHLLLQVRLHARQALRQPLHACDRRPTVSSWASIAILHRCRARAALGGNALAVA